MKIKLLIMLTALFANNCIHAQANLTGTWNGELEVAGTLHLVLHVTQLPDGKYSGTLDSPDQSVYGIKCDKVEVTTDVHDSTLLAFTLDKLHVSYTGKLVNDSTISGTFTQGAALPLTLNRSGAAFATIINRPQTPKPPFPYKSEEVVYAANGLQYSGTITSPQGNGKFPAVLLITGSGQQDRDETMFAHKPFAVLADALTRDGFIVLRVDDRGIGNSTGDFANSTTADFIKDINASVDYLKTRPAVDDKKIGLLGHSEGGIIAPVVASQRNDIDFIVLMAAPGVKIIDLMTEQYAAVLKSLGLDSNVVNSFKPVYHNVIAAILTTPDTALAKQNVVQVLNNWYANADSSAHKTLGFTSPDDVLKRADEMYKAVQSPWYKYFLQFDPAPYLTNLKKVKVLTLNGSRDIQVSAQQNLPAISNNLVKGKTKTFEVKELPGLNHLFQTCKKCTVQEYGQLEETIAPVALQTITDWLNKNVK